MFAFVCLFYFFMLHYFFTTAGRAKTAKQDSKITRTAAKTLTSGACPRTATSDEDASYHLVLISTA